MTSLGVGLGERAEGAAVGGGASLAGRSGEGAGDEPRRWDDELRALGGHLLQSSRWGEFKKLHGWRVERVRVVGPSGVALAQVLFRHRGPASIGYVPRGPVLVGDGPALWPVLREAVDAACVRHRALDLIVEPNGPLPLSGRYKRTGFVRGPGHLQPVRTVKVPLVGDDALLNQMHQKTRYNVRLAQRRGVQVERMLSAPPALRLFYGLLEDTSKRNQFGIHGRSYYEDFARIFGDDVILLFARVEGTVAAGLMAARFGDEAIYMYGGSSTEHRAHGAAFYLQFEAMRWARDQGCTRYDLWGIPAVDPASTEGEGHRVAGTRGEDWRGLYKFKVGFGGEIVTYPPTLERRYLPVVSWVARRLLARRG